jgi:hypothetical protein
LAAAAAQRDADIIRLKDQGKSNREVAREVGVHHDTVVDIAGGKWKGSKKSDAKAKLRELASRVSAAVYVPDVR